MQLEKMLIIGLLVIFAVLDLFEVRLGIREDKKNAQKKLDELTPDTTHGTGWTQYKRDREELESEIKSGNAGANWFAALASIGFRIWIISLLVRSH